MSQLSLSIAWNNERHTNVDDLITEIKELGFKAIELNYKVSQIHFSQFVAAVHAQKITVPSIHNYCPFPEEHTEATANPDFPDLASIDEETRKKAVKYTTHTILSARIIGAKCVVLHAGKVACLPRTKPLIEVMRTEGQDSKVFTTLQKEAISERREKAKIHGEALCTSISELIPVAQGASVILGMENRFHYHELPSPDEFKMLFRFFGTKNIQYWHDMGHAYVLESLGFYLPQEYLVSFHKMMVGMHIHDIMNFKDHQAPFTGEFDWSLLKRYDLSDVLKVIEIHSSNSADSLCAGAQRLEQLLVK
jgi:sugar phosphate isomerase/epimerase